MEDRDGEEYYSRHTLMSQLLGSLTLFVLNFKKEKNPTQNSNNYSHLFEKKGSHPLVLQVPAAAVVGLGAQSQSALYLTGTQVHEPTTCWVHISRNWELRAETGLGSRDSSQGLRVPNHVFGARPNTCVKPGC